MSKLQRRIFFVRVGEFNALVEIIFFLTCLTISVAPHWTIVLRLAALFQNPICNSSNE